ncbi:hypothetical protein OG864_00875 [Streptomyces sp. NBC_00124]|uniref:hypothetical protein n=1 Tax=Streptomyces sp. NBC_00124 TaxID=2975662 RepID=UPI00224D15D4|nr:hypothetical protein [Streptomyces sp. NBC_00124]MCX5357334.1 hypothetical protein [Streptomyces sp. NBC_00124]
MEMPDEALRNEVSAQPDTEAGCARALERIEEALTAELKNQEFGAQDMPAVYAWASLISFAVGRTYGPASPMRFPGFAADVAQKVASLGVLVLRATQEIASHLGENTIFGVSVGFPWGVSVSLSFEVSVRAVQDIFNR